MIRTKFGCVVLSIIITTITFCTPVSFAETGRASTQINAENVEATPGSEVAVRITISGNPGIIGAKLEVSYNKLLTLKSATSGDAWSKLTMTSPPLFTNTGCSFVWDTSDIALNDIKDGAILILNFIVSPRAVSGDLLEVSLSSRENDFCDRNVETVDVKINSGGISVRAVRGDFTDESSSQGNDSSYDSGGEAIDEHSSGDSVAETGRLPEIRFKKNSLTYNGKVQNPELIITGIDSNNDYSVVWSKGSKNVGTYSATVLFVGENDGEVRKLSYVIKPKGTSIKTLSKAKKSFTVRWSKQSEKMGKSRITGYQIQYSTTSNFSSGNMAVKVKGYTKTSKKFAKLKASKKYYVRVRTYMTVKNRSYYSKWSKTKSVITN